MMNVMGLYIIVWMGNKPSHVVQVVSCCPILVNMEFVCCTICLDRQIEVLIAEMTLHHITPIEGVIPLLPACTNRLSYFLFVGSVGVRKMDP